jgi:crotonobetainyl-CoA:carnitine CoA-transferase CaiB-like acyl-CoA transferase
MDAKSQGEDAALAPGNHSAGIGPLSGVKVIDFTRWFAGPLATSFMGDLGADVIKIERPGSSDGTRHVDTVFGEGWSSYFLGVNRSKRYAAVDYRTPAGKEVVDLLLQNADVLISNFRPGTMDELGFGFPAVSRRNPKLIVCEISSFGAAGPHTNRPGMDLVVQAMGGIMSLTGPAGGSPTRVGAPIADYVGALQAFGAVSAALYARANSGKGQRVDVALLDGQIAALANYVPSFFVTGRPDGPVGVSHPQLVPYQQFATRDGEVIIACLTEQFWKNLCTAIGMEHLVSDKRFIRNAARVEHRAELVSILQDALASMSTEELVSLLANADVPFAPIQSLADLAKDPQVEHNAMLRSLRTLDGTVSYRAVGTPFRFGGEATDVSRGAGPVGYDTRTVLEEAGMNAAAVAELVREGVCAD